MKKLLIVVVVFVALYALVYMYLLLRANNNQVAALQSQIGSDKLYRDQNEKRLKLVSDSLKNANDSNQQLRTVGGGFQSIISSIF